MKSFWAWIKQWAATCVAASSRIEFYRRVGERKTGEAVGHLAMLAVVWVLPVTVLFFVGLRQAAGAISEGLRTRIPPGTTFEMKDGVLTNNLQEPLVFTEKGAAFIVNTATTTLELQGEQDGLVVGATGIFQRQAGQAETLDFKDVPDFRVDREGLMEDIARWAPLGLFVGSLVVLIMLFLAFWSGGLLNALVHGFVLWLLLKIVKRAKPWRHAFVAASYAATAPFLLRVLTQGLDPQFRGLADILYWAFIAWIAYDAYKTPAPTAPKEGGAHERKEDAAADRPHPKGESGPV